MYELKKIGKVLSSKSVRNGPSSYEKRTYRAAVSQRFRNTAVRYIVPRLIHRVRDCYCNICERV